MVGWTYDGAGNLTNDGTTSYSYDALNRQTQRDSATYAYNGDGTLVAQTSGGTTTRYTQDLAAPLSQVLNDGTANYIYGRERLAGVAGTTRTWYQGDALGSVRQTLDDNGAPLATMSYDPWGTPEQNMIAPFGFTGELQDAQNVYLRARWYSPSSNTFMSIDRFPGFARRPNSLHPYNYAFNNPVSLVDHSGYSPKVDCSTWPNYVLFNMREWCNQANGSDNDATTLDARERIYWTIVEGGRGKTFLGNAEGYGYAADLLSHFLQGDGGEVKIQLSQNSSFGNDPGITRATREYGSAVDHGNDEADEIVPLIADFMENYVKPAIAANPTGFNVKPIYMDGKSHYHEDPNKQKSYSNGIELGTEPKARDTGWWAAFGHVTIDGTLSAAGYCAGEGYLVYTRADYSISDYYDWFRGKLTPLPLPGASGIVQVPHDWALSLVDAGRAKTFPFTVTWSEMQTYAYNSSLSQYRPARAWERIFGVGH